MWVCIAVFVCSRVCLSIVQPVRICDTQVTHQLTIPLCVVSFVCNVLPVFLSIFGLYQKGCYMRMILQPRPIFPCSYVKETAGDKKF